MQGYQIRTDPRPVLELVCADGDGGRPPPGHLLPADLLLVDLEEVQGDGLPGVDHQSRLLYSTGERFSTTDG